MSESGFVKGIIVPGLPQPLLAPEQNEGWGRIKEAFEKARQEIAESDADVILVYSTMWPSVIGHQIQADPAPKWVHVDELFHDLGSIPYEFKKSTVVFSGSLRTKQERKPLIWALRASVIHRIK